MSQSIIVKATFKNNKRRIAGLHNPKNNRVANIDEIDYLYKMYKENIRSIQLSKFKSFEFIVHTQDRNIYKAKNINEALFIVLNDKSKPL